MAIDAKTGIALAQSGVFTGRLQVLLCQYAQVIAVGDYPAARKALATRILSDPGSMTGKIAVSFVSHPNVEADTTTGSGSTLDIDMTDPELDAVVQAVVNGGTLDSII